MDELTTVCTCSNMIEAQAIRAALEARGLFVHVDGMHYNNIYAGLHAAMTLRIMVPRSELAIARELASDVAGELPPVEGEDEDEDDEEFSPHRRPLESDLARYGDEDEEEPAELEETEDDALEPRKGRHPIAKFLIGSNLVFAAFMILVIEYELAMGSILFAFLIWLISAPPDPKKV